jgi:hypothetical protein
MGRNPEAETTALTELVTSIKDQAISLKSIPLQPQSSPTQETQTEMVTEEAKSVTLQQPIVFYEWINSKGVPLTWDQIANHHELHDYSDAFCAHYPQRSREYLLDHINKTTGPESHIAIQRLDNYMYEGIPIQQFFPEITYTVAKDLYRQKLNQ